MPIKYLDLWRQCLSAAPEFWLIDLDAQMVVPLMESVSITFAVLQHRKRQSDLGVVKSSQHLAPLIMVFDLVKKLVPEEDFLRVFVQAR